MKSAKDVASDLYGLFHATFGGKQSGRFKISRDEIKTLSGRVTLRDDFLLEVFYEVSQSPYFLKAIPVAGDAYYGFIEETKVLAWRSVPSRLLK